MKRKGGKVSRIGEEVDVRLINAQESPKGAIVMSSRPARKITSVPLIVRFTGAMNMSLVICASLGIMLGPLDASGVGF